MKYCSVTLYSRVPFSSPLSNVPKRSYNTGGTPLLQVPTLQKSLLLPGFLAPPQAPVAFVAFCTIVAACALLHLGRQRVLFCIWVAEKGQFSGVGSSGDAVT